VPARSPPKSLQPNAVLCVEAHALASEPKALEEALGALAAARADLAARVDDALPWDPRPVIERAQCVTDQAGLPGEPREARYLSVGRHAPLRDARDHGIDARVGAGRIGHGRQATTPGPSRAPFQRPRFAG